MDIIARLRKERQDLVERVTRIDKMLEQLEEIDREARRLLSLTQPTQSTHAKGSEAVSATLGAPQTSSSQADNDATRRKTFTAATPKTPIRVFEAAVIEVLRETGQPMDRVALYEALTARGIVIGDGDRDKELNSLSARVYRMARDGRLTSQRGEGYSLKSDDDGNGDDGKRNPAVNDFDGSNLI